MIHTRYLSGDGWVEECSHHSVFDAYMDARRRCVLRGCLCALMGRAVPQSLCSL